MYIIGTKITDKKMVTGIVNGNNTQNQPHVITLVNFSTINTIVNKPKKLVPNFIIIFILNKFFKMINTII